MLSEGHTNVSEHFPKFSEVFRSFPKTSEDDSKMFLSNMVSNIIEVIDITYEIIVILRVFPKYFLSFYLLFNFLLF